MLKLKLQYFSHLMQKADSFEKTLLLGKIEGRRRRGWQRLSWVDGISDSMDMGLGGLWELVMDRAAWHAAVHAVTKSPTWLSDWTELNGLVVFLYFIQLNPKFDNTEFMIWATVSSRSCFSWLYRASPSLAAKNIINLILVLTIWWYSCVESSLVLLDEGVCYNQCVFLAKRY